MKQSGAALSDLIPGLHWLDWVVLFAALFGIVLYGVWKGGRARDMEGYMLANREIPWYRVGLSIMATQASAITFLSTTGQGYADGMRFVQFYFGLPLAMVVLCVTFVPIFHRLRVYTAYEYLEQRFDLKTRALTALLFLVQRGFSTGLTIYAPALVLSLMLGWDVWLTTAIIGVVVIVYTFTGGAKAVGYTHTLQMGIIWTGMFAALVIILRLLPEEVSVWNSVQLAGSMGRMQALTPGVSAETGIDWNDRYTLFSGLLGGFFLQLSYFGTDQSQVQRYLTARSVTESRLGLILNGLVKVPMQVFILFVGVMVFVFYQFQPVPMYFHPQARADVLASSAAPEYRAAEARFAQVDVARKQSAVQLAAALDAGDTVQAAAARQALHRWNATADSARAEGIAAVAAGTGSPPPSDADFVFATFFMNHLPVGLVGLLIAVIFAASMSSISGALSAITSSTIVDVYQRLVRRSASDAHYVQASRISTLVWGIACIFMATFAARLGNLIEAVNILGSLFYGTILGIFLVAFYLKRVGGAAVFVAACLAELIVVACFVWLDISYLWYNVIGCLLVPLFALPLQWGLRLRKAAA